MAANRCVEQKGEGSGVGAIAGGVLGGVLGNQVGSGRGNTAATIVGAGARKGRAEIALKCRGASAIFSPGHLA